MWRCRRGGWARQALPARPIGRGKGSRISLMIILISFSDGIFVIFRFLKFYHFI